MKIGRNDNDVEADTEDDENLMKVKEEKGGWEEW